ncbi:MAG TPA: T9SS type A sorting domain-containing protein [Edaphocola sp.]|nr:T9SS type A sorting domain-containing protein [Edaphocola sp.]
MFKKISTLLLGCAIVFATAQAQDFTFVNPNPLHDSTAGFAPYSGSGQHEYLEMWQYVKNISNSAFTIEWRSLSTDTTQNPPGWILTGICDNINCRGEYGPWYYGNTEHSAPVDPGSSSLMLVHVYVPASSADTVGIYKVEIKTPNQTDTAIYMINKDHSLGLSAVRLDDNRVSVYPNPLPAGQNLNLYVDKSLKANKAVVYNIIGQKQMTLSLANGKELNRFDIRRLPAGMYVIKINNTEGQTISSRKFTKQ